MDFWLLLKFGILVPYVSFVSREAAQCLKSTYLEIHDGGRPPNL